MSLMYFRYEACARKNCPTIAMIGIPKKSGESCHRIFCSSMSTKKYTNKAISAATTKQATISFVLALSKYT